MINRKRYYKFNEEVNFDEDLKHEFKNHLSFTNDNISSMTKKLHMMKPISQSVNAFLNSGIGGIIYLGIKDCGTVKGFPLTDYQRDHIQLCLDELLKCYQPAVPQSWIHLEFIRVVTTDREFETEQFQERDYTSKEKFKSHSLGYVNCWCFANAKERIQDFKEHVPSFVVEMTFKPWDANDTENENLLTTITKLHPIFEDEHGDVWMRRLAGNRKYSKEEVFEITVNEVTEYYRAK